MEKNEVQLYVIARYWRGCYVETVSKPIKKDDAYSIINDLKSKEDALNDYRILRVNRNKYNKVIQL